MEKVATVEIVGSMNSQTNVVELMRLFRDKQNEVKIMKKRLELNRSDLSREEVRATLEADLDIWIKAYMKDEFAVFEFHA